MGQPSFLLQGKTTLGGDHTPSFHWTWPFPWLQGQPHLGTECQTGSEQEEDSSQGFSLNCEPSTADQLQEAIRPEYETQLTGRVLRTKCHPCTGVQGVCCPRTQCLVEGYYLHSRRKPIFPKSVWVGTEVPGLLAES